MDLAREHDEACRRAAAFWSLGPLAGAGATIWKRVIADELERYDDARGRFRDRRADLAAWERIHGLGMVLVVAISQVVAFAERVKKMSGDAKLARALDDFTAITRDVRAIRDLAVHLDEYAVGAGHRQRGRGRQTRPPVGDGINPYHSWMSHTTTDENGVEIEGPESAFLDLGEERINLHSAARAAMALADVTEQTRYSYEMREDERADLLVRRMGGR